MGFFTDLKEDLSQATGELMSDEDEILDNLPDELLTDDESLADDPLLDELLAEAENNELAVDFPDAGDDEQIAEDTEDFTDEASETEFPDAIEAGMMPDEAVPAEDMPVDASELSDYTDIGSDQETNMMKEGNDEMSEDAIYVATAEAEMMKTDMTGRRVSDETALITGGMMMVGDITSEGSLELEGTVSGNIDILGKLNITGIIDGDSRAAEIFADNAKITGEVRSLGSVKIGQSTVIIGNIFANSAVIAGAVKGDIDVQGPVILDTSAIVMGNIKSKSVQINNGAVIEGMCSQCYAEVNPTSFFEEIKKGKKT
jgi:cytoskeletal protein CcmA (bactofilin family)